MSFSPEKDIKGIEERYIVNQGKHELFNTIRYTLSALLSGCVIDTPMSIQ